MTVKMFILLNVETQDRRYEWHLGSKYIDCECVRGDDNDLKMMFLERQKTTV